LPAKIRFKGKWMVVANTLVYYEMATTAAVKNFKVQATGEGKVRETL
jgi:hypothetical protein